MSKAPKTKRRQISTRIRFEIFKRDGFTCQYCGAHPPQSILHVDHIVPVKEGGGNEETNLVTACETCNLGKAAESLQSIPASLADRAAEVAEREAQLRGYSEVMAAQRERIESDCWQVADVYMERFLLPHVTRAEFQSIKTFVERLGLHECLRAMDIATSRQRNKGACFRYFCGIAWRIIKEGS